MLSRHAATPGSPSPSNVPLQKTGSGMDGCQNPRQVYGPVSVDPELEPALSSATLGSAKDNKQLISQPESCHTGPSTANRSFPRLQTSHRRQHSTPNIPSSSNYSVPQVTPSTSSDRKSDRPLSVNMPLTGDNRSRKAPDSARGGVLSGWLGSGTPNAAGDVSNDTQGRPSTRLQRRVTAEQTAKVVSPSTSRFAFLSSPMSAFSKNSQASVDPKQDDELLTLNIHEALFPPSSPTHRDAFSPAAFKNLEATAVGLLARFQNAYQRQNTALHQVQEEREAHADETEEADTRIQHLKVQLENMASKVAEQEQSMQQLLAELTAEKKARQEERAMRERGRPISEGSSISEDLSVEEDQARRKWRKSSGFDTDEESVEDASVFSRSRSPTTAAPSVFEGGIAETSPVPAQIPKSKGLGPPKSTRPAPLKAAPQQTSVFQKLMRGVTGDTVKEEVASTSCANCRGRDERAAWDTVGLLRDENRGLKHRVAELESCVDGALDAVNGIRLD